jgi:hypothetical protein
MDRMLFVFNIKIKYMEQINYNSGQIHIIGANYSVYLYTHDYAKTLVGIVHDVLSKQQRWDDPDYLTRMLFCAMIPPNEWDSETGFGIGTQYFVDTNLLITIDLAETIICISSFGSGVDNIRMDMNDFVQNFYDSAELG